MMKTDWITITCSHDLCMWSDCYDWCIDTWGRNDEWVYMGPGKFHFKNKSDAVMFMLKWVR
jgi:hypothetical protein